MKKHIATIIFVLLAVAGVSLLMYPTVSNYMSSLDQQRAIAGYTSYVMSIDKEKYKEILAAARAFNEEIAKNPTSIHLTDEQQEVYEQLLNISDTGMMGYLEIPSIDVMLPIYHGTGETVLQKNVGHIEGSSLPIGGASTHSVLSGHRGLPSAKLFTDIDKLDYGDIFTITILKETYTYEVDRILTVLPDEPAAREAIGIEEGKDYCTLVTCTPYGINTHRLLVRGHRIETPENSGSITTNNDTQTRLKQVSPFIITAIAEAPIILIAVICILVRRRRHKR